MRNFTFKGLFLAVVFIVLGSLSIQAADGLITYNRENDLYKFSKRNVHFSPFFRGSSSSLEYHLKGF